ncbi:MAG: hypothetical protein MUF49_26590, partial [Oculatellaceae cyanobacterium Prado106]|nr:hypothetical protein [Oculatellaceae cyanobacterium Prado106]
MDALMQQEIAPIHPVKLSQVQAEREEATSYIDAAQQLKQEGYIEEADDCLTKAVVIYQTLVDQLLGAIDSAELFRLMSRQIASPVKQFQQFDEWRKEA